MFTNLIGKHMAGVDVPSANLLNQTSAYKKDDVRKLGDSAVAKVMKYDKDNPYDAGVEAASRAEGKQSIENQRKSSLEDINEKGVKGGYNSGLMDKLKKGTQRTYDDASIEEGRRSKLDFVGRRTSFDMDLLDKQNMMAQFGSQQQQGNIWNRVAQKQAQAAAGMQMAKDVMGMVGGGMMGGA